MVLKKVTITGASGTLGYHLIKEMVKERISLRLFSRHYNRVLPKNSTWNHWDLTERQTHSKLDQYFGDTQAIIHAGANVPRPGMDENIQEIFDANVRACNIIGEWANKRAIHLIFISGATVYKDPHKINILETDAPSIGEFGGFYGYSKYLAEHVLQFYQKNTKICILRPSSIYGINMTREKMIPMFLKQASQNDVITLQQPVDDKVNFIYGDDLASAILQVLKNGITGTYNIAADHEVSIHSLAKVCIKTVGKGKIKIQDSSSTPEPRVRFNLSISKAKSDFDYSPTTRIESGIKQIWAKFQENLLE
jgi:UDP-glucose 4-epimerase